MSILIPSILLHPAVTVVPITVPIAIVLNRNRPCMIQLIQLNTVIQFYQWPWSIQDNTVPTGSLLFPIDTKLYHLWLILNPSQTTNYIFETILYQLKKRL